MPIRIRLLAIAASTTASLLMVLALVTVHAGAEPAAVPQDPQNTLTRQRDPVVVQGSSLPEFAGAPLNELFVYAYNGGIWHQIPFQLDEVEPIGNTYVVTEDGQLDANDELAFMALDAGAGAGATANNGASVYPASLRTTGDPFDLAALAASIPIPGLTLQELRISLDLLNPTVSGYAPARYINSNIAAAGMPVDGAPDTVPTALAAWSQYNGSLGSIVLLNSVQTVGTSAFTYYLDNARATAADCHGTDGAYGESGVRIAPFSGVVTVTQQLYFAPPLSQAAGTTYQAYSANPLQTAGVSQLTCFFADLQPDAGHTNPALCDNDVDIADVQRVAGCWNQAPGSPACPTTLDVDRDTDIDAGDIAAVAGQWGWS